MFSLKKRQSGFTIVELLIVIVVIGILATLVIVTFTGIQQKSRNSQRQTDINAVASHVEAFYAQWGFYPTQADLASSTFRSSLLKGLDPEALRDPKAASGATIGAATSGTQYSYVAASESGASITCTNTTATTVTSGTPADNGCTSFTLIATLEGGSTYEKKSN